MHVPSNTVAYIERQISGLEYSRRLLTTLFSDPSLSRNLANTKQAKRNRMTPLAAKPSSS